MNSKLSVIGIFFHFSFSALTANYETAHDLAENIPIEEVAKQIINSALNTIYAKNIRF